MSLTKSQRNSVFGDIRNTYSNGMVIINSHAASTFLFRKGLIERPWLYVHLTNSGKKVFEEYKK